MRKNLNKSAVICTLFFLFMPIFGITLTTIQNFPDNMIAGSIYEAKFSFNSDMAGNYKVFINISNVGANESSISDCTEFQAGQFVCERNMVNGLNTLSLYLNFSPYIAPAGYPISLIFAIPYDDGITGTQIISSSSTGGGISFQYPKPPTPIKEEQILPPVIPPPPIKEEPKNESEKAPLNLTNNTKIINASIPAQLLNITNYTNYQTPEENTIFNPLSVLIFIIFIILLFVAGYFIFNSKQPPIEQPISEVIL